MSDALLNTTVKSFIDSQNYHRDVIVLGLALHKRRDFVHEAIAQRFGVRSAFCARNALMRDSPKHSPPASIASLTPSVKKKNVSSCRERQGDLLEVASETLAAIEIQSKDHSIRRQHVDHGRPFAVASNAHERRMAGARARQRPCRTVDNGVRHRNEAAAVEVVFDNLVGFD
jgi:hypothetical protein